MRVKYPVKNLSYYFLNPLLKTLIFPYLRFSNSPIMTIRLFSTILLFIFCQSNGITQCYNLVWEDEFNGSALDLTNWEYQIGGSGWGNNELQYYTAGDNITVSAGILKITAKEDIVNDYPDNAYTSSRIRSRNQGDWRYGKMEASIKLPVGQGIWSAFWMMPTESIYGGWPSSGEIDIMEYLGHQLTTTYGTCHYGNAPGDQGSSGAWTNSTNPLSDAFHTFTVAWEPTQIRWYFDSVQFHVVNDTDADFTTFNWPFDEKFHFILNVAVGGDWPGAPDGTTVFPQSMEVDWVRVYQELPDVEITGNLIAQPSAVGEVYTLPNVAGAAYSWTIPAGATIVNGQNTNEITVNWGSTGGDVTAMMTTACGTQNYARSVEVTPNLWLNYDFENDLNFWSTNEFNGANANFDLVMTNVQEGTTSLCVTTLNLTANRWDIQLGRANVDLTQGEDYTISFWAKADQMGKDADLAIINASTFIYYAGNTFLLTDSWAYYSFNLTSPVTATTLFNFDLGDELGTFCFDDFSFARTVLLPVEYTNFWAQQQEENRVVLHWITNWEEDVDYFEVQKSSDLRTWETIGKVTAKGEAYHYQLLDKSPFFGQNYYRFKSVDLDGTMVFSEVIAIKIKEETIVVYPNPFGNKLTVIGKDISFVEIFNLAGQKMKRIHLNGHDQVLSISVADLPKGIYLVKVFSSTHLRYVEQFIKMDN
jgi:beta-glucanase (GH16 family)